jgi:hypothetical protein
MCKTGEYEEALSSFIYDYGTEAGLRKIIIWIVDRKKNIWVTDEATACSVCVRVFTPVRLYTISIIIIIMFIETEFSPLIYEEDDFTMSVVIVVGPSENCR